MVTFEWFDPDPLVTMVMVAALVVTVTGILRRRRRKSRHLPPEPWPWPVVGHVFSLLKNPHLRLSRLRDEYGDVYQLWCGERRVVVVSGMEGVLGGLQMEGEDLSGRPDFASYQALYPSSRQEGVCTGDVSEVHQVKRDFISSVVDEYCSDAARIEEKLSSEIVSLLNQLGELPESFDPSPVLHLACLNVALNLTFSQRFDPTGRMAREVLNTYEFRSSAFQLTAVDFAPVFKIFTTKDPGLDIRQLSRQLVRCNRTFINFHKDSYDPNNLRDFTDRLLLFMESGEDGGLLHKDDLDYLLLDMTGHGFQAVAVTLTWLLGYMALNPDIQSQVQQELDEVVGRDSLPCLSDQPYLPLTEAVIYEAQRLASVHPILIPHYAKNSVCIQGYEVPADTVVLFNVWGLHHDPRYWTDPGCFNPKRFLNEDETLEIPDHFIPFGVGSRCCPGESLAEVQLFLFFTALMHQFKVQPANPRMTLEGVYDHLLRPKSFQITVTERE